MNTEPGLACDSFCLHDFRPGPVIVAVIPLIKSSNQMPDSGKWKDRQRRTDGSPPIVRLRPNSDEVTTKFKIKRTIELLQSNSEVQIVVKMRGREKAKPENAKTMLQSILSQIVPQHAHITSAPKSDGSQLACTVGPLDRVESDETGNAV